MRLAWGADNTIDSFPPICFNIHTKFVCLEKKEVLNSMRANPPWSFHWMHTYCLLAKACLDTWELLWTLQTPALMLWSFSTSIKVSGKIRPNSCIRITGWQDMHREVTLDVLINLYYVIIPFFVLLLYHSLELGPLQPSMLKTLHTTCILCSSSFMKHS